LTLKKKIDAFDECADAVRSILIICKSFASVFWEKNQKDNALVH